jgi:GR25 family glycosyltransferase involved in LPS biosynthesis
MKAFVITMLDLDKSVESAERCIESAKEHLHVPVSTFAAITPKDNPEEIFAQKGYASHLFDGKFARREPGLGCFLSHSLLWEMCQDDTEDYLILEHDALFVDTVPRNPEYYGCLNLGKPSYGTFKTPEYIGVSPLVSKPYFGGSHAYLLKPWAATTLLQKAKTVAEAADIFLKLENFPWLEEYYPWPIITEDRFTTVQHEKGCTAKHSWDKKSYLII